MKKVKKAFTLAEAIFVVAILGTVAAVSTVVVLKSSVSKTTTAKVLRAYEDLQNAFNKDKTNNKNLYLADRYVKLARTNLNTYWYDNYYLYDYFIKPNFQITKNCGFSGKGCFPVGDELGDTVCKFLDGTPIPTTPDYTSVSPCTTDTEAYHWAGRYYKVKVKGNYSISFQQPRTHFEAPVQNEIVKNVGTSLIAIDINNEKAPNTIGKDIFVFVQDINGIHPITTNTCHFKGSGLGCSGYIIKNKNMDYLK